MPQSEFRARQVGAKTNEVVNYHKDDSVPGKPLYILIPGGLVALVALGVIILIAYLTWFEGRLTQNVGLVLIGILFPFYVGGVFLFSYGYELYNIPRAIRLTAIIVFFDGGCRCDRSSPGCSAGRRRKNSKRLIQGKIIFGWIKGASQPHFIGK